ncbi:MAG: hypothetical protein ACM35G_01215, partial [Planctomycetaceae bacterium]
MSVSDYNRLIGRIDQPRNDQLVFRRPLTGFAVGRDDADVFVDGAAGGADSRGSRVHEDHYHDEPRI